MRKKLLLKGTLLFLTRPRDCTTFTAAGVIGVVVDCFSEAAVVVAAINS